MASYLKPLVILSLVSAVQAVQPSAPDFVAVPLRELKWGQINFLHTTDTHGWLAGHLSEYEYQSLLGMF
jgi:2',3'-cyclic-nucleotide 2'-phosphodiesterase (5'-nucleotidase family)